MQTNFKDNLKRLRVAQGVRQSELSEKLGVSRATVNGWESGYRSPSLDQATKIADALGCTVDQLVRAAPDRPPEPHSPR